jgi:hypothetical protein
MNIKQISLECRKIIFNHIPDHWKISAKVFVYQSIPHPLYERPWNMLIIIFNIIRKLRNSFSDYLNVIKTSLNNQKVRSKILK